MARSFNPSSARNLNRRITVTGRQVVEMAEKLAASKKARVVRKRGEFDPNALAVAVRAPYTAAAAFAWPLAAIMAARDAQIIGQFALPARLVEAFNTDDAIFTARSTRLAPIQSLDVKLEPGVGPEDRAKKIADEADALFGNKGIAFSRATENSIRAMLVDHGVAFGAISWAPRDDGTRWDPVVTAWPIEHVRWDAIKDCYVTRVDPASGLIEEEIRHGNGRWIVFAKSELLPHRSADATLLPAALVWPCHAFANRDRRKGSASHGNAKIVGTLPENTPLKDPQGGDTKEVEDFMNFLHAVASQEAPFGIKPTGSTVEILANPSNMWQVFSELAKDSEKAAARIYLGTDGILGSQGGAPGIDITALFGVHMVKVQSDLQCMNDGLQTGAVDVWCAWNFGDSKLSPRRGYVFPDPDRAEVQKGFGERNAAFLAALKAAKEAGFPLTDAYVACLAEKYGVPVPPSPSVSSAPATAPTTQPGASATGEADAAAPPPSDTAAPAKATADGPPIYGYHMEAGVVTPNEVRAQLRLPPIPGGDDLIATGKEPAPEDPAATGAPA